MTNPLPVPAPFAATMASVYGDSGREWVSRLPALLDECAAHWRLRVDPPFALTYNYVAPATRDDGREVVLKVGYPSRELGNEVAALRTFAGRGIAALLDDDEARGAFLLERLRPGTGIDQLDDEAATSIAARVMRNLWTPPPEEHAFPHVADWGRGFQRLRAAFDGGSGPFPEALVARAEELFASLLASSGPAVLLHGDLHHGNILAAERAPYLAIDPKGVVGEPAFETASFLSNPQGIARRPGAAALIARRIDQLTAELALDRARIRGWGLAQAVLSAWWTWEDHGEVGEHALACARLIAATPE
jgi:streptomycin 6-kinase